MRAPVMDWLRALDHALLLKINREWTAAPLDALFPLLTDLHKLRGFWPAAAAAAGWWVWKGRKAALRVLIVAGLAVGAADLVNHRLLKPYFSRSRPEKAGVSVVLRTVPHSGLSFPSNHAANMGAAAAVLSSAYPAWTPVFVLGAGVVAYSRVYCGVHFPADAAAGLLLGALLGRLLASLLLVKEGARHRR